MSCNRFQKRRVAPRDVRRNNGFVRISPLPLTALLILAMAGSLPAATIWTGATDSDWATPGNWDNGVPGLAPADPDAVINAGATNQPTINQGTTDLEGINVTQNGGTVTGLRAGPVNTVQLGEGGNAVTWDLQGGVFNIGSGLSLALTDGTTFTVSGGELSGGGALVATEFTGQNFAMTSGTVNLSSIGVNRRTSFLISGGSLTTSAFELANAGLAANPNYDISFSGGDSSLGALGIYYSDDVSRGGRMSVSGDAILSATSLTFAASGTPSNELGQDSTYIDFASDWTGSFGVSGATSLTDYWNLFDTNTSTAGTPFIRVDGGIIDQNDFNAAFTLNGSNALVVVPEPTALTLLGIALALALLAIRRRSSVKLTHG